MQKCETCRFWFYPAKKTPLKHYGECRRNSPKPLDKASYCEWPKTHTDEGCGDHEPKQA